MLSSQLIYFHVLKYSPKVHNRIIHRDEILYFQKTKTTITINWQGVDICCLDIAASGT